MAIKMKVLDGRNPHKVPQTTTLDLSTIEEKHRFYLPTIDETYYILKIDGKYIVAGQASYLRRPYSWVLCAEYKSLAAAQAYIKRQALL